MALVTVQRTPSGVNSPQSSEPESGGQEEEDSGKTGIRSLSECYFAGKGTVLMLGSNERLVRPNSSATNSSTNYDASAPQPPSQQQQHQRSISNLSQYSCEFVTTTPTPSASQNNSNITGTDTTQNDDASGQSSTTATTNGNDIQKHLQSMFYLLRPEETLKMAVKLESIRAGRTRYLVVVSRPVQRRKSASSSHNTTPSHHSHSFHTHDGQHPESEELCISCSTTTTTANEINKNDTNCDNNKNINNDNNNQQISPPTTLPLQQLEQNIINLSCTEINPPPPPTTTSINERKDSIGEQKSCFNCRKNSSLAVEVKTKVDNNEDEIEESCLLGIDCNEETTVGLVLKVLADTTIRLDGDGGFSVSVCGRTHIFKPVSVQAMWSALQTLHKVSGKARENNFFAGGPSHQWAQYYEENIGSDRSCLNEWHTMDSIESRRPASPDSIRSKPTEREETEIIIRTQLKEIIMSVDLDEVTSKYIRTRLESQLNIDLSEYKSFIDEEMLVILGQMDAPTEIFDHVYLGSEWNASNLDELQRNGVGHILNVTREIDNFFPGCFDYFNVRVYDDDKTNLLRHWDDTYKYISQAKEKHSKVLVHCKMGISRSASVVIAYAMKAYNWDFETAMHHVKIKRSCIKPNRNFMTQLETYQGMLDAMKNKEKLQRSKSDTNLKTTKDARLLPGSEPTPLIQALTGAKGSHHQHHHGSKNRSKSESNYKKVKKRPRSCSPENRKSTCTRMHKPHSISLEHLADPTRSITCTSVHCNWNKTVLIPCDNGQNYSVSQNQIVHLEQHDQRENSPSSEMNPVPSVKLIVSELELNDRRAKEVKRSSSVRSSVSTSDAVKENLDPSDLSDATSAQKPPSPMWSSSTHIHQNKTIEQQQVPVKSPSAPSVTVNRGGDLFSAQVDRVFEREEKKQSHRLPHQQQQYNQTIPPNVLAELSAADVSRNNSWSSVDSAVVMAETPRDLPSRHSSWGSGDNRTTPSRNSSWGSYDMRNANINNNLLINANNNNNNNITVDPGNYRLNLQVPPPPATTTTSSSSKEEEPSSSSTWTISGTVKRTKQKIEERAFDSKRICSGEVKIRPKKSATNTRCSSEEVLSGTNLSSNVYSRLSASAPETVSIGFASPAYRHLKNFSSVDESDELNQQQQPPVAQVQSSPQKKKTDSNNKNRAAGMVKNLKMNFEAKVTPTPGVMTQSADATNSTAKNKKKGRSLPSSPVHTDPNQNKNPLCESTKQEEENTLEDINVRNLVDKYEETKMRSNVSYRNSFPASSAIKRNSSMDGVPSSQQSIRHHITKQRPMSVLETTRLNHSSLTQQNKPLMISHSTIFLKDARPPPAPHHQHHPTTTSTKSISVLNKTNNNNNNNNNSGNVGGGNNQGVVVGCKKFLQHGKTHPLARLDISKQKLNTATPFNTM